MRLFVSLSILIAFGLPFAACANEGSVRSCARHGPGFVEVPGTATCIRIGGLARAEAGVSARRGAREIGPGMGASARLSIDTRTDTAYGPLRSFVRLKAHDGTLPSR